MKPSPALKSRKEITWGLSRFSRSENGTVPFRNREVILLRVLKKILSSTVVLVVAAAVGACRRAAEAPVDSFAAERASGRGGSPQSGGPLQTPESVTPPSAVPAESGPATELGAKIAVPQQVARKVGPSPIELAVRGPDQAAVGDQITFELVITNRGETAASGLLIKDRLDPGLEHEQGAGRLERDLDELAPGESKRVGIRLRVTRPGTLRHTVEVIRGANVLATAQAELTGRAATDEPAEVDRPGQDDPSADGPTETRREWGPPLVDDPESLQKLHPFYPVWIDRDCRHVVMVGQVCQRQAPLELFACLKGSKEHESVVVVDTKAYVVHAGLLAARAEPGSPVRFVPEFVPARGTEIEVTVVWEDASGRRRRLRAQDWVHDVGELYAMFGGVVVNQFDEELYPGDQWAAWKSMEYPWVFAGSRFSKDERTGDQYYQADVEGDLICVSNFPSAVLDVPIRSSDSNAALLFSAFTERIPPRGTPVTLILTPKREKEIDAQKQRQAEDRKPQQPGRESY